MNFVVIYKHGHMSEQYPNKTSTCIKLPPSYFSTTQFSKKKIFFSCYLRRQNIIHL